MPITFEHTIDGDTLRVITSGNDENLEEVGQYAFAVLGLAIQHNCTKICTDERNLKYELSVIDTFEMAEQASQAAKGLKKIAIVCSEEQIKDISFYENVARNRGLAVMAFQSMEKANDWLMDPMRR